MPESEILVARPERWDVPFGATMHPGDVDCLLREDPFRKMDPDAFPPSLPLRGILQNDTRLIHLRDGDLIVREGDYGNSAFLVLEGHARVALEALSAELLGHPEPARPSWLTALAGLWKNSQRVEVRKRARASRHQAVGRRLDGDDVRIFLQDVPRVLDSTKTARLGPGEFFGELAALSRTPRTATVFAEGDVRLLEIRWQGLRDLMHRTPALREHIDRLYRENSLRVHLRETPLLRDLPGDAIQRVAEATEFLSFGTFAWHEGFGAYGERDPVEQLAREPVIIEEGRPVDGLLLVRSGFARLSHCYGNSHRTVAYLGKGRMVGMAELANELHHRRPGLLRYSLRAVGYVDVLKIPRDVALEIVLPHVPEERISEFEPFADSTFSLESRTLSPNPLCADGVGRQEGPIDDRLLDFLVDHRLVNGTETMLIDLDRCTRCDDCVQACAATHDNNPRFIRHGPQHDRVMIANACMHCIDPVCMIGCPTGAIARDQNGLVRINDRTCIGCATCANSCPYDAIRMVEIRDASGAFFIDEPSGQPVLKATKCDLCADSLTAPACQAACPHDALVRHDMGDLVGLASWLGR